MKSVEERYEELCSLWSSSNASHSPDIFSDHLLVRVVSGLHMIDGIDAPYNRTREAMAYDTVINYSGNIRDFSTVMNSNGVATFLNMCNSTKRPVSKELICHTHSLLMFSSLSSKYYTRGERAGEFKKSSYCVGRHDVGADPDDVPILIGELCTNLPKWIENDGSLSAAARFHCNLQNIHPFADGNGRLGRWLLSYILVLNNHPPVVFDPAMRTEYYQALEQFDTTRKWNEMIDVLIHMVVSGATAWKYLVG